MSDKNNTDTPDTTQAEKQSTSQVRLIFARNFRAARKDLKLSQRAIQKRCGVTQSYLSNIERSKQSINIDHAALLADAVATPLWKLLKP